MKKGNKHDFEKPVGPSRGIIIFTNSKRLENTIETHVKPLVNKDYYFRKNFNPLFTALCKSTYRFSTLPQKRPKFEYIF